MAATVTRHRYRLKHVASTTSKEAVASNARPRSTMTNCADFGGFDMREQAATAHPAPPPLVTNAQMQQ